MLKLFHVCYLICMINSALLKVCFKNYLIFHFSLTNLVSLNQKKGGGFAIAINDDAFPCYAKRI